MKHKIRLNSIQILAIGFAILILTGAVLLSLPIASRSGNSLSFLNALFTSTSATCVTGLIIADTYTQFSGFGQAVILLLIQIGGLGFMMIGIAFTMIMGKKVSLRNRNLILDSLSMWQVGNSAKLIKRIIILTITIELSGAALLATRFIPKFGFPTGIWYSIFHSVSAFCNAGFDLMGRLSPGSSLTFFYNDVVVNVTIMLLILIGGLGFFLWLDVIDKKWHFSKYQLHTKIMLVMTALLIVIPTLLFIIFENNYAFLGMSPGEKVLAAFFQSVTPRTAGFNTVSMASLSDSGALLTMILMFIGAGPGSTGGGLKVTTFAVLLLTVISRIRNDDDVNVFHRRLEDSAVKQALSSIGIYFVIVLSGVLIICFQGFSLRDTLFESLSALSTVGLSTGITSALPALSRIVLIIMMYSGRVGSLSVAMAVAERRDKAPIRYVSEKIIIG